MEEALVYEAGSITYKCFMVTNQFVITTLSIMKADRC